MNQEVNVTKRVQTLAGLRYCPVVLSANGRIKPDAVLVNLGPGLEWFGISKDDPTLILRANNTANHLVLMLATMATDGRSQKYLLNNATVNEKDYFRLHDLSQ